MKQQMRRVTVASVLLALMLGLAWPLGVGARESIGTVAESEAVQETVPETDAATEAITEAETEADGDDAVMSGLYDRGRRWAEENPEVFSAIVTAMSVLIYGFVQFLGYMKAKRTVVKSSNNAVELYRIAAQQIADNNKETLTQIETANRTAASRVLGINQRYEEQIRAVNRKAEESITAIQQVAVQAMEKSHAAIEAVRRDTGIQTDEMKRDREAVLLLSRVIGRLLEESSLPSRVRDEIHGLVSEAKDKLEGESHEESTGE